MNTPLWPAASPPAAWKTLQDMVAQGIVPSTGQLLALLQQIGAVTSATMIQTGQGLTGGPLPGSAELRLADVPAKHVLANMSNITAPPVPTPADGLGWVRSERVVQAGTGLAGGGDLSVNRTISLQPVNPAGDGPRPTIDVYGRVTELAPLRTQDLVDTLGAVPSTGFATLDALRAFDGPSTTGTLRQTLGDGAGTPIAVDEGDTTTPDDGVTVFVDGLGRRWRRLFEGSFRNSVIVGEAAGVRLYSLPPLYSTAIGIHALGGSNLTAAAGDNVAVGSYSQHETTTAAGCVSVGSASLRFNQSGDYQTALGAFSLFSNTTGRWNAASGYQTLYWNATGHQNTASGTFVLFQNTTADDNTGVGYNALQSVTNGDTNTAVGANALYRSSSVATGLSGLIGGAGYVDGTYRSVPMDIVSGYPITPQLNALVHWFPNWPTEGAPAVRPRCDITVVGGVVTACTMTANALTALSWAAGVVTGTTTNPHGLQPGDGFWLTGCAPLEYSGFYFALAGTTGATLKYALAANPGVAFRFGKLDGTGFSVAPGTVMTAVAGILGAGAGFRVTISTVRRGRINTAIGAAAAGGGADGALSNASSLTGVGAYALSLTTTGDNNVGLGAYAGFRTSSGEGNTLLGTNAGYSVEIGNRNIVLGAFVDPALNNGDRQLNIGNVIFGTRMYDGSVNSHDPITDGKVGICVVPTTHMLEVAGIAKVATPAATTVDDTVATASFVGAAWTAYTPVVGAGSGGAPTSASATGRYKRVGKLIYYIVQISIPTNGAAASYLTFTLPAGTMPVALGAGHGVDANVGNRACSVRHVNGSNVALIFRYDGNYPAADGSQIYVSGFYEAA